MDSIGPGRYREIAAMISSKQLGFMFVRNPVMPAPSIWNTPSVSPSDIILNMAGLINVAIILYAAVVLFQLVTLPVEFNASHRAMDYMKSIGLPEGEVAGSFSVLRACALTYVAAALASLLQLVYLLGMQRD